MMYHSLVDGMWYLVHTKLDITFIVGYVSMSMEKPILYSKRSNNVNRLTGYSDSDRGEMWMRGRTPRGSFLPQ